MKTKITIKEMDKHFKNSSYGYNKDKSIKEIFYKNPFQYKVDFRCFLNKDGFIESVEYNREGFEDKEEKKYVRGFVRFEPKSIKHIKDTLSKWVLTC